jgi:hypothetical protein
VSALGFVLTLRFLDAVIALVVAEAIALGVYRSTTGRGMPPSEVVAFLGAGLAMVVGLRLWVAGASAAAFAGAMGVSLVLHVWHVAQRWRR